MMSSETLPILVWCWHDPQTYTAQVRTVRVDTGEEVQLSDGVFLLRISTDENGAVIRCQVRHLASGREAYLQGGASLRAFVDACLLNRTAPPPEPTSITRENAAVVSESHSATPVSSSEASPPETSAEDRRTAEDVTWPGHEDTTN